MTREIDLNSIYLLKLYAKLKELDPVMVNIEVQTDLEETCHELAFE